MPRVFGCQPERVMKVKVGIPVAGNITLLTQILSRSLGRASYADPRQDLNFHFHYAARVDTQTLAAC